MGLVSASGPVFVLLALGLVALGTGTFLVVVAPFYNGLTAAVLWICAVFITYCIVYNYLMAVFTPPGSPPHEEPTTRKTCRKCKRAKVARAHHCSVCKQCILRMDHHCIWIANCVGHANHKYFFLFMYYVLIGCIFWNVFALPIFLDLSRNNSPSRAVLPVATLTFAAVMLLSLMFALGLMFAWQCYLVLTNQTTIEWHDNRYSRAMARARGMPPFRNPFDLGAHRNLADFLAVDTSRGTASSLPLSYLLALLPHTRAVRTSGIDFELAPIV